MRVLLDATAVPADRGGVGRYVDALVPELVRGGVDLVVACQEHDAELMAGLAAVEVVPVPGMASRGRRFAWEQTGLPRLVRRTRAELVHSPHYTMPLAAGVPVVVTLHDATFFSLPHLHTAAKRAFFRTWTRASVRRAAAVVVPSIATRDEVRRYAGGRESAFHVAYHGVDVGRFHPVGPEELERVRAALDLAPGERYVAFLGTLEPRKNVPALVRAWVAAVTELPAPPALLLAGGPGWDPEVDPALARVPAGLRVQRLGYLPLEDLAGYLAGAVVVAYPSLGEGFGLPVLEAMACGAPVLTTRELSLPEVGGDAVAYCDPDTDSIRVALGALLDDPGRRDALAAAALSRAAGFTWERAAAAHVEAYRAALTN